MTPLKQNRLEWATIRLELATGAFHRWFTKASAAGIPGSTRRRSVKRPSLACRILVR